MFFKFLLVSKFLFLVFCERIIFTQCECNDKGPFLTDGNFLQPVTTITTDDVFSCPADNFEAARGVIRRFSIDDTPGQNKLASSINSDFFLFDASSSRWLIVVDFDARDMVISESYSLIKMFFPTGDREVVVTRTDSSVLLVDAGIEFDPLGHKLALALVEGEQAGQFFTEFNICLLNSDTSKIFCTNDFALNTEVLGDPLTFPREVGFELLNTVANETGSITITAIQAQSHIPGFILPSNITVATEAIRAAAAQSVLSLDVLPVPQARITFVIDEDDSFEDDIRNTLGGSNIPIDVEIVTVSTVGTVSNFSNLFPTGFTYTTSPDFFGNDTFDIDYQASSDSLPYACIFSTVALVIVNPVEDIPVLRQNDPVEVAALSERLFTFVVATSVDFPENNNTLFLGKVIIEELPSLGEIRRQDCIGTVLQGSEFNVINSVVRFCFIADKRLFAGSSDEIRYTVETLSGVRASGTGSFDFIGANPVVPLIDRGNRVIDIVEDSENVVLPVGETFASLAEGVDPTFDDFFIQIVDLPSSFEGILLNSGGDLIARNDVFSPGENISFAPQDDFFNANALGLLENDDGDPAFSLDCIPQERINTICPGTFTFLVVFGKDENPIVSNLVDYHFVIRAENDGNSIFDIIGQDRIAIDTNEAINGIANITLQDAFVTSDNGGSIFQISILFETEGFVNIDVIDVGVELASIAIFGCTGNPIGSICQVELRSVPSRINEFLEAGGLRFFVLVSEMENANINIFLDNAETFGASISFRNQRDNVDNEPSDDENPAGELVVTLGISASCVLCVLASIVAMIHREKLVGVVVRNIDSKYLIPEDTGDAVSLSGISELERRRSGETMFTAATMQTQITQLDRENHEKVRSVISNMSEYSEIERMLNNFTPLVHLKDEKATRQFAFEVALSLMTKVNAVSKEVTLDPPLDKFNQENIPDIKLNLYLLRLIQGLQFWYEQDEESNIGRNTYAAGSLILGLHFLNKLQEENSFALTQFNVHKVMAIVMLVAAKFIEDKPFSNSYWAVIAGITTEEVNALEELFCFALNFDFSIKPADWKKSFSMFKDFAL